MLERLELNQKSLTKIVTKLSTSFSYKGFTEVSNYFLSKGPIILGPLDAHALGACTFSAFNSTDF